MRGSEKSSRPRIALNPDIITPGLLRELMSVQWDPLLDYPALPPPPLTAAPGGRSTMFRRQNEDMQEGRAQKGRKRQ